MTPAKGAELAQLVMYAMDMHVAAPASLAPAPDLRLAPNWKLLGYIVGMDAVLRAGRSLTMGDPSSYGYVVRSLSDPTVYAAAIRGTNGIIEWLEDAKFLPMPHPIAGKVETGFFTLYETLQYLPAGSGGMESAAPLAASLARLAAGGHLYVIGHSLGAPLAAYLTFDLAAPALLGRAVEAVLFASPRPGNAEFGATFDARVQAYTCWNYDLDVVPRLPIGPDYADLPQRQWITPETAQARIAFGIENHHHLVVYAALLDYNLADWQNLPGIDGEFARESIKGPN